LLEANSVARNAALGSCWGNGRTIEQHLLRALELNYHRMRKVAALIEQKPT
jgi:hypothetical protein